MTKEEVTCGLKEYLASQDVSEISEEEALLQQGILDSMAFIMYISHIEQAYCIEITEMELSEDNFSSISRSADFIMEALGSR